MNAVHELIDLQASRAGDQIAIRFRGSSISYANLARRSVALADVLAAVGVGKGTRLGLAMGNRPEWLLVAIAASRIGALLFPLSTFLREGELADTLRRAAIEAVVYSPAFAGMDYDEILRGRLSAPGSSSLSLLAPWREDADLPDPIIGRLRRPRSADGASAADPAIVFYTSGSTGEPKGVLHAHGPMIRHAQVIARRMGIRSGDRSWSTFPFFFSAGIMIFAYSGLVAGATLVVEEKFEAARGLRLLEEEKCTVYQGWPHQIEAMMADPHFPDADLSHARKSNGALFLPHDAFLRHPHDAIDGWGMTETLTYCCSTSWEDPLEARLASHGPPLEGVEIRIADPESGCWLEPGSDGELCVRGYNLMLGYLDQPQRSHLDRDGFFHGGDLGSIDPEGNVHFRGRLKEIIKTAGVNVSAAEVEKLLASHAAVEAAYVVGVPDPSRGELIAAFVVRSSACAEEDLVRFAGERTARYKVPRWIFFAERADLPQTGSGKILKTRLREIAIEKTRR